MEADAALVRPARAVVLDAIAGEDVQVPVRELDRDLDLDLDLVLTAAMTAQTSMITGTMMGLRWVVSKK